MKPKLLKSYENFINILDELKDNILIVEGKKDFKALKSLGMRCIIAINSKPLIEVVHRVLKLCDHRKEVIILTDFDEEGKRIAARLEFLLRRYRVHPNSRLRCKVMNLGINKIEDLKNWNKEVDIYVKISSYFNKISHKGKNKGKGCGRKTGHNRCNIRSN